MAADWIKIEHVTPDKPEVHSIAADLGIDPDAVTGKLVRLWIWADQQTLIGYAPSVTDALLDRIAGAPGFAMAMKRVGWLSLKKGHAEFPNFDRHNGKTAKNRGLSMRRMQRSRCADSVTNAQPEIEKRREEKSNSASVSEKGKGGDASRPSAAKFKPPSIDEVRAYCRERGNTIDPQRFMDHYESNGWRVGKNPMKDWKAAIRTWERSEFNRPKRGQHDSANADRFSYRGAGGTDSGPADEPV